METCDQGFGRVTHTGYSLSYVLPADVDPWRVRAALSHDGILNLEAPRGGRHLDTEVNEVYISLLPAPPDPEEEEEVARVEP